ncbi:MAG TPA: 50S ribosomal protein L5 [Candidatus Wolfebacteria bacterium]|nr:50S ribosomal protein L5 [Candidatus Wolfebacteria bacterium]
MASLKAKYNTEIVKKMKKSFGYKNDLAVPKLSKVVINVGVGRLSQQPNFEEKILPEISKELSFITGQKPLFTAAKKSIAGFKTRAGQTIGLKTTLRRQRMYDFLERLINITMPRVRDFRGINLKSVDKKGNLTIGMKDQLAFPEINLEFSKIDFGLEITIVSNAAKREEAIELYRLLGIPLKK